MATADKDQEEYINTSDSTDYFCQPCSNESKTLQAESFCVECAQYLCQTCTQHHKKFTMLQHHKLLSMDEVEKEKPKVTRKDKCTVKCFEHKDKSIKYFCVSHSYLGCSVCITLGHKSCKNVLYIPEVSEDIRNTEEYKIFERKLQTLESVSKEAIKDVEMKMKLIEKYHYQIKDAMKQQRKEINDAFDKLENEINTQAETIKQEQAKKLQAISTTCSTTLTEIEAITSQLDKLQTSQQNCDTFVTIKQTTGRLETLSFRLSDVAYDTGVKQYVFQPNTELHQTLKKPNIMGKLCTKVPKAEYVTDINVQSKTDKNGSWITGTTILPNYKLAVIDRNNYKLKILDRQQNKLTSELSFSSAPRGVTKITESQVAVTLPQEEKILFVTTYPTLVTAGEIQVNGECHGVVHRSGRLVVTFRDPDKVEIMDLEGYVTESFTTDDEGQQLFSWPYYASLSPDNKTMYVSNYYGHSVVSMSLDGQVLATYKDSQLSCPREVLVKDRGSVYVCGADSHNIHHITPDCNKVKLLLTESDGLKYPYCISLNETGDMLYVGMEYTSNMKVYMLT